MITETYRAHMARTGKTLSEFSAQINKSPQSICNLLRRTPDPIVIADKADRPVYVGYYRSFYEQGEAS